MRHPIILAPLLGLTLLGAAGAYAQDPDQATMQSIEIRGDKIYKLAPHEFDTYVGIYKMDSNSTLKVWQRGSRFYSQLRDQPSQELVATSPGRFVTTSGARLKFLNEGNTVVVTGYDRLTMVAMR
jgi:hypothetical protein